MGPFCPPKLHLELQREPKDCSKRVLGSIWVRFWIGLGSQNSIFCNLFSDKCLGRLPGRFFIDFGCFFCAFFDDFFELFSGLSHKRKCHSDTLSTMFEAHCRYRKYVKNVFFLVFFGVSFAMPLQTLILSQISSNFLYF